LKNPGTTRVELAILREGDKKYVLMMFSFFQTRFSRISRRLFHHGALLAVSFVLG